MRQGAPRPGHLARRAAPLSSVLAALLSACGSAPVQAEQEPRTWYVRADGGDASRCSGRVDRSLAAAGNSRDCAWQHPFVALPPGRPARIGGGDTLFIRAGDYRMGHGAPDTSACSSDYPWDCHMPPVPSGPSAATPTRISGLDADGLCSARPQLWGAERAARVLNLDGSRHVRIECLEITDRASCAESHCHGGECREVAACPRERFPYGDWAGTGVFGRDSADVELVDLDVHGMAVNGFRVGRVRDWTLRRVRIIGNGWAGWDGDLAGEADSANDGTLRFEQVEIAWNGCVERYPGRRLFGCWAQHAGGYGDGLGTAETGGHWVFDDVDVHHNTSDGLDLLYIRAPGRATVSRLRAHANAGNQFKASGQVQLSDSVIDGSCGAFRGVGNITDGELCRAQGTAVALVAHRGVGIVLRGNRVSGNGDCLVVVEGGDASSRVELRDNELRGRGLWNNPRRRACGFYAHDSTAPVAFHGNAFLGVRNRQCPPGSRCADTAD